MTAGLPGVVLVGDGKRGDIGFHMLDRDLVFPGFGRVVLRGRLAVSGDGDLFKQAARLGGVTSMVIVLS